MGKLLVATIGFSHIYSKCFFFNIVELQWQPAELQFLEGIKRKSRPLLPLERKHVYQASPEKDIIDLSGTNLVKNGLNNKIRTPLHWLHFSNHEAIFIIF